MNHFGKLLLDGYWYDVPTYIWLIDIQSKVRSASRECFIEGRGFSRIGF